MLDLSCLFFGEREVDGIATSLRCGYLFEALIISDSI